MKKQLLVSLGSVILVLTTVASAGAGPNLATLGISPQSSAAVAPGNTARFLVSVNHAGNGNLESRLQVFGLPGGATASFSEDSLRSTDSGPSQKFTVLTVNVPTGL